MCLLHCGVKGEGDRSALFVAIPFVGGVGGMGEVQGGS